MSANNPARAMATIMALPILSVVGHRITSSTAARHRSRCCAGFRHALCFLTRRSIQHIAEICEQIDDENEDSKDQRQALYHG